MKKSKLVSRLVRSFIATYSAINAAIDADADIRALSSAKDQILCDLAALAGDLDRAFALIHSKKERDLSFFNAMQFGLHSIINTRSRIDNVSDLNRYIVANW